MTRNLAAALAGLVFGLGLSIAGMIDPAKVLNFLDLTGTWDPSLAFVMGGGVIVAFVGFRLLRGRRAPLFDDTFRWPTRRDINARLVIGAALFGVGWGLVGLCPGPAVAALALDPLYAAVFVAVALAGMAVVRRIRGQ
jgi:uncharacterized membrane protein YedE/YeeE